MEIFEFEGNVFVLWYGYEVCVRVGSECFSLMINFVIGFGICIFGF